MSRVIQCDGCQHIIAEAEVKIVAADVSIKDNPDRMHLCAQCFQHAVRFLGDLRAVQSGGIIDPDLRYCQEYLDVLRQDASKRCDPDGQH